LPRVVLKKGDEKRIRNGHLWIFSNEIIEHECENGDIAEVFDSKKKLLGHGFYNSNSLISVRMLPEYSGDFNLYAKQKLLTAKELRAKLYPHRVSFRLVFSESDFLPGLIIDKYNSTFVLQIYCFGMEKRIDVITEILKEEFQAENIFSLNNFRFRKPEGLPEEDTIYYGSTKDEIIDDGKLNYLIDFTSAQKTGFYFDQCDNREFIGNICCGKVILDTFCFSGGFGMHSAKAGAAKVTFVDASQSAIKQAECNYKLNRLHSPSEFICCNVFSFLEMQQKTGNKYGVVITDPPAFAQTKKNLRSAVKGYIRLNMLSMQVTEQGGFLVTSSCSYHLGKELFMEVISEAAAKCRKKIQLLHFAGASMDHPVIPAMNETSYLKFAVLKII
jgi:23S rRNA (cytosine1962-C5)-methyltransferase